MSTLIWGTAAPTLKVFPHAQVTLASLYHVGWILVFIVYQARIIPTNGAVIQPLNFLPLISPFSQENPYSYYDRADNIGNCNLFMKPNCAYGSCNNRWKIAKN